MCCHLDHMVVGRAVFEDPEVRNGGDNSPWHGMGNEDVQNIQVDPVALIFGAGWVGVSNFLSAQV